MFKRSAMHGMDIRLAGYGTSYGSLLAKDWRITKSSMCNLHIWN
jgi:hypothetical protein